MKARWGLRCLVTGLLCACAIRLGLPGPAAAQPAGAGLDERPPVPADAGGAPLPGDSPALAVPAGLSIQELRRPYALAATGAFYGGLYGWTYLAWYQRSPDSEGFNVLDEGWFGPDTYAGGADKLGHFWTNYALTRGVTGILEWGGYPKRTALPAALALTAGFFVMNEIKDGYHRNYGFSWGDILFNVAGDAAAVLMELNPELDAMFDLRLEYFPSRAYLDAIGDGNPFNSPEDYSGQSYLLAYHLASVDAIRASRRFGWLEFVDLTVGYQAVNFLPETDAERRRVLYAGVALNLQRLVERVLMAPAYGDAAASPSTGVRTLHFVTEIYAPPGTTLKFDLLDASSAAPPTEP